MQCTCQGGKLNQVHAWLQVQRQTEQENAAAEAEQLHLQEEEWNMAELERIQEQQVCLLNLEPERHIHLPLCSLLYLHGSVATVSSVVCLQLAEAVLMGQTGRQTDRQIYSHFSVPLRSQT